MGSETEPGEWRPTLGEDMAARLYGRPVVRRYDHHVGQRGFEERQLALGTRQAEVVLALRRPAGGYLLHTASAAGLLTQLGSAPYSVTKHAAVGFAEWLSVTYGDQGVQLRLADGSSLLIGT